MTSDLISRKALCDNMNDFARKNFSLDNRFEYQLQGLFKALDFIEEAPTVDAVEVVRCKDCLHYSKNIFGGGAICQYWQTWTHTHGDDFCSYGVNMDGKVE